jgi:hypothetical protein
MDNKFFMLFIIKNLNPVDFKIRILWWSSLAWSAFTDTNTPILYCLPYLHHPVLGCHSTVACKVTNFWYLPPLAKKKKP